MPGPTRQQARKPRNARYERDVEGARLDAEAAQLRSGGATYRQIAEAQGVDVSTAHARVFRAIAAVPVEAVNELRSVSGQRLDRAIARAYALAMADHPLVYRGQAVSGVFDRQVNIAALRELRQLDESRRKLFGVDVPAEVRVTVKDDMVEEIERLAAELGLNDAEMAQVNA